MTFAERYPTEAEVRTAVRTLGVWTAIRDSLGERPTPVLVAWLVDPPEARAAIPYRRPTMDHVRAVPWNGLAAVSSFSGCGGSTLGLRMAGWRVPYAVEFVPAAADTYEANSHAYVDRRDVREIEPDEILDRLRIERGDLDLLEESPPCAAWSAAGVRERGHGAVRSYSDTRQRTDDLFDEWVRLVEGLEPRALLAENVPTMLEGSGRLHAIRFVERLGYAVKAAVLNAANYGVPQAREGSRRDGGARRAGGRSVLRDEEVRWLYPGGDRPQATLARRRARTADRGVQRGPAPAGGLPRDRHGLALDELLRLDRRAMLGAVEVVARLDEGEDHPPIRFAACREGTVMARRYHRGIRGGGGCDVSRICAAVASEIACAGSSSSPSWLRRRSMFSSTLGLQTTNNMARARSNSCCASWKRADETVRCGVPLASRWSCSAAYLIVTSASSTRRRSASRAARVVSRMVHTAHLGGYRGEERGGDGDGGVHRSHHRHACGRPGARSPGRWQPSRTVSHGAPGEPRD
jgi:hypothetical protein